MFGVREWCENFRLNKDIFDYLCTQLTPYIHYEEAHLQKVVSVKKCAAITLWTLALRAEYRNVSHLFWC